MNNRKWEKYFSPFSKKGFKLHSLFLYKRETEVGMLSLSTKTTQGRQPMPQEDQKKKGLYFPVSKNMKFNTKVRWNFQ